MSLNRCRVTHTRARTAHAGSDDEEMSIGRSERIRLHHRQRRGTAFADAYIILFLPVAIYILLVHSKWTIENSIENSIVLEIVYYSTIVNSPIKSSDRRSENKDFRHREYYIHKASIASIVI